MSSRSRSRSPVRWDRGRNERTYAERQCARDTSHVTRQPEVRSGREFSPGVLSFCAGVAKADIVPEFDPEKPDLPALQWLNKIEQLGAVHGWSDGVKSYYMQARLAGLAKLWHNTLRSYDGTWKEWREKILEAFPQRIDYAEALKEMLSRRKHSSESMTHYYYSKCNLLTKCEIVGERAVSCIIEGLPPSMKTSARAGNFKTPGDLYSHFLSVNEDIKADEPSRRSVHRIRDQLRQGSSKDVIGDPNARRPITCFLCNESGHVVRFCPNNPYVAKCDIFGKVIHRQEQCFQKSDEDGKRIQNRKVSRRNY